MRPCAHASSGLSSLTHSCAKQNVLLPHQAITRFGLARSLPLGEETTFAKMAEASGQAESNIRKIVRAAIAQRIFEEPRPGVIKHSAASRMLAENPGIHDYVATVSDELWPAAAQTCNAWAKFPGSEEPNETVSGHCHIALLSRWRDCHRGEREREPHAKQAKCADHQQSGLLAGQQYHPVYV